jgi:hypothetical protein
MKFQVSAITLGCIALLSGCGGGGGGTDGAKEQTIDFQMPFLGQATIGVPPNSATTTLKATASSGGAVTYSSATPDVCSVNGDKLTLLKLGECSVIATQAGANGFAPVSRRQTFVVPKNPQMISSFINPGWQPVGGKAVPLTATFTSGLPPRFTSKTPSICSVSGNTMTPLANGMCTITVEQDGNDYYMPALLTDETTLGKAMALAMSKNIPIGTEKPAMVNFLSGYKDGDHTIEGLIGHAGNQWWCDGCDRSVSSDGSTFTFTSTFDKAPQASEYYKASFQLFATGIGDNDVANTDTVYRATVKDDPFLVPDPASPKGARVDIQTALHFRLAENPEWFGSANNQVKVEMFLAPTKKADGSVCRMVLQSTVQPTAAAATDYTISFKDNFTFSEACGISAPDVATYVQLLPVVELRFSAVQPNGQVANAASKYVSQFMLTGPVYFQ